MAEYKPKGQAKSDYSPYSGADWGNILAGMPYSTKDLEPADCCELPPPLKLPDSGTGAAHLPTREVVNKETGEVTQEREKLYPAGPWEVRTSRNGDRYLVHVEIHRRARMWQYRKREDTAREQFTDQRGGKD